MKKLQIAQQSPTGNIGITGLALAVVAAVLGFSVNASNSVQYINIIGYVVPVLCLVVAVALGIGFAGVVSQETGSTGKRTSRPIGGVAGFVGVGLFLLWMSHLNNMYLVVGAVLAFALAGLVRRYANQGTKLPPAVRNVTVLGAFAAGMLPGFVLYVILAIVVSERYCQLTSSKCL